MVDIRMIVEDGIADIVVLDGDLEADDTLRTAVLISLFTDTRAGDEEDIPDGGEDRRGWWAQERLEPEIGEPFGSLLWLLERSKVTNENLALAEEFSQNALEWLITQEIADAVDSTASRLDGTIVLLEVTITRGSATEFPEVWEAFRGLTLESGPLSVKVLAA